MELYYSPGACSLASHIILREIGKEFDLVKVDLVSKSTESGDDYKKINPHGYVPALKLVNDEILTEGVAIMQYLADQSPESNLSPTSGTLERSRLHERLNYLTAELHKSFTPLFYEATDEERKKSISNVESKLDFINNLLSDKNYLLGDKFTIADAYLFVITNLTGLTGIDLEKWPNIVSFSERVAGRDSVQKSMQAEGLLN